MADLFPNIANIASRVNPDGSSAQVANVLSKLNPALDTIPWREGNLTTGHQITQTVNALPSGTWRKLNRGVPGTVGETANYVEACGVLEDESTIDEVAAELNGGAAFRASEDDIKTEGLYQQLESALFYSSTVDNPEQVHGLSARYPATSGFTSSGYTLKGTNTGSACESIWLVGWGDRKVYGIYPKGTMAGLESLDRGRRRILDGSGNHFYAWCTTLRWRCGFAVEDYRYAVRFQWDPTDAFMAAEDRGVYLTMMKMLTTIFKPEGATLYGSRNSAIRLAEQLAANNLDYMKYLPNPSRPGCLIPYFHGHQWNTSDNLVPEAFIS